ncbi:DUF1127 domain-containing protein [uncultured Roseibium sp.]|uniref:DUF1127 domain-containing protein n=1 Tax=uncultured Roseibium sp. TaxID=1936171 RepID=UPI00260DBFBE|nr:DUF1127 domain-containing protein [uncultured Roseibium sp.]
MSYEIETVFRSRAHSRGLVFTVLRVCADQLRRYVRRRTTARALSHLNEGELKDIGLMRTGQGYRELHRNRYGADFWK